MDYADQLLLESRNNINFKANYTRRMPCPNRWKQCPSGMDGKVDMLVKEDGMWTTICCPVCGYSEFWSIGDGDELF